MNQEAQVEAVPDAPPMHAQCANPSCLKVHESDLSAFGPEKTLLSSSGVLFDAREMRPICSERCRRPATEALRSVVPDLSPEAVEVVRGFDQIFYDQAKSGRGWVDSRFLGIQVLKNPLDLHVLQEIVHDVRPEMLVETGTYRGGSALYFATLMDALGRGFVHTIDSEKRDHLPIHPRIVYFLGSSVEPKIIAEITRRAQGLSSVMVVLDSDHSAKHVSAELHVYAPLVTPGSYLVVEDTNKEGPAQAVREFLSSPEGADFEADRSREKFLSTFNPGGYLRRRGGAS